METKEKPRLPRFYKIYFICLAAAAAVILIACLVVRGLLAEFEGAQPKYAAEAAFGRYFSPIDYDALLADAQYSAGLAGKETVREYIAEAIGDAELTWSLGSSEVPEEMRYIVKAGGRQIGAIDLAEAGKTSHGFQTYQLARVELAVDAKDIPGSVVTVEAPAGSTVTVDGLTLTSADAEEVYMNEKALKYFPSGTEGLEYARYTLPQLTELPRTVSACDAEGRWSEVSFDAQTNVYTAGPAYSQELADQYSDFVTRAVEGYAAYMQRVPGSSFAGIKKYFDPDAPLYSAVSAAGRDLWMVKAPSGNDFEDLSVGEFYPFSDELISCHISFTQVLHRNGEDHPDAVNMYVFLRQTANGFRIFEWYNA